MERTKKRISEIENGIMDLLRGHKAVFIPDEKVDMSVFQEYTHEREGIGVYYPIWKDGSCAEPVYVRYYRSAKGLSMELSNIQGYAEYQKERLRFLLRS